MKNCMYLMFIVGLLFHVSGYNWENHVLGGIAQADVLGIFGKYGIDYAYYWEVGFDDPSIYIESAFKLFRNYDGANSTFGDTFVDANTADWLKSSIFASIHDSTGISKLHIMLF